MRLSVGSVVSFHICRKSAGFRIVKFLEKNTTRMVWRFFEQTAGSNLTIRQSRRLLLHIETECHPTLWTEFEERFTKREIGGKGDKIGDIYTPSTHLRSQNSKTFKANNLLTL